jgi:hypothetical protein
MHTRHPQLTQDATPFAEFLWVDFFHQWIKSAELTRNPDAALKTSLTLCHSAAAAHLPGWTGEASPLMV